MAIHGTCNTGMSGLCSGAFGHFNKNAISGTIILGHNNDACAKACVTTVGQNNVNNGIRSVSVGLCNTLAGDCNISIGFTNGITGADSINIGNTIVNGGNCTIAIGKSISTSCNFGIGIGQCAQANALCAIAIGSVATVTGCNSIVIGNNACSGTFNGGHRAVAIGACARSGDQSIAIGQCASADADRSVAIGPAVCTGGLFGVNIGFGNCTDSFSFARVAIGCGVGSASSCSFVIGEASNICSGSPFAGSLGWSNTVGQTGAIAIGQSITTEREDTVHLNHILALGQGASKYHAIGTTGGTPTINWNDGNNQSITLSSSATPTITNPIAGASYSLAITQGASGSATVTWPASVKWAAGTTPTLSTGPGLTDVVSLIYTGSQYYGLAQFNFA
jgi:hypothetical protein